MISPREEDGLDPPTPFLSPNCAGSMILHLEWRWRVEKPKGASFVVFSSDHVDGRALKEGAERIAGEAFGEEFRISSRLLTGRIYSGAADPVYTTLPLIRLWQPGDEPLPHPATYSGWREECRHSTEARLWLFEVNALLRRAVDEGVVGLRDAARLSTQFEAATGRASLVN